MAPSGFSTGTTHTRVRVLSLLPNRKAEPPELTQAEYGKVSFGQQGSQAHFLVTCSVALSKSWPGLSLRHQFPPLHNGEINWIGIPQTLGILYVYRPVKFENVLLQ